MADVLTYLALIVMVVVAIILLKGLLNMMRGGSPSRSQQLMRMRVLFQALAVLLIVGALVVLGGGR
jgi:hypothetical protein